MKSTIDLILNEYLKTRQEEKFKQNPIQKAITQTLRNRVLNRAYLDKKKYSVKGSAGQGTWANVPWFGIFDRDISTTAEQGFYIVYLFAEDMSGVYLSLNQGWTFYKSTYGREASHKIEKISEYLRGKLRSDYGNFSETTIDLKTTQNLGKGYEKGNIIGKYYKKGEIPSDSVLTKDLWQLMRIFRELKDFIPHIDGDLAVWIDNSIERFETVIEDDDESFQIEVQNRTPTPCDDKPQSPPDKQEGSKTGSYKRDPQKAQNALANAQYRCEYDPSHVTFIGESTGHPYVEAHHLIPMKNQPKYEHSLDVEANIVALCPNCHKKIHLGKETEREEMKQKLLGGEV